MIVSIPDPCPLFYFARYVNNYKHIVLFMGHRQTVKTQIRCHKMRRLIRVSSVCLQVVLLNMNKIEKYHPKPTFYLFLMHLRYVFISYDCLSIFIMCKEKNTQCRLLFKIDPDALVRLQISEMKNIFKGTIPDQTPGGGSYSDFFIHT